MPNYKIEDLISDSVEIMSGMVAIYPLSSQEEVINVSELIPKFNGCYAINNSTVCYIYNNEIFVTPYTRKVINTLSSAKFIEKHFFVPLSNGNYPKNNQSKWNALCEMARQSNATDFAKACISYSNSHHIGTLKKETLQNCFEMPSAGIIVKHHNYFNCYYPIINTNKIDSSTFKNIGHFCFNNGKVIFVYCDGKTYLAKGYKILEELQDSGYTPATYYVPFSNGEEIQDKTIRSHWNSIKKIS